MRSKQKQQKKSALKQPFIAESILNRKIVSPQKLKILVLAGNELLNEHLDFLQKCINLIKLDLSHNHITKLPEKIQFKNLEKLEVLQLHNNKLASLDAIEPIFGCKMLVYLSYHHNPIQTNMRHEHSIINTLTTLKLMNNRIIYVEQRIDGLMYERPQTFVDPQLFQSWKSTENSEAYYLKVLNMQLQFIDNMWAFNNPIIFIQRAWKHFLPERFTSSASKSSIRRTIKSKLTDRRDKTASKFNNRQQLNQNHPLKSFFQQWKEYSVALRQVRFSLKKVRQSDGFFTDKTFLLQPLAQYNRLLRNMRVQQPLIKLLRKIRRTIYERKMAYVLMANIKMKTILFDSDHSFYDVSGIKQSNKIWYNRNQQHIIDNLLETIAQIYNKREVIYNKSSSQINKQYNAIRLVDPETFVNKYSGGTPLFGLACFLWPSMKLVTVNRKKTPSKFKAGIIGIRQLSYIRNRDKVVSKAEYQKSKQVYRRLQKFAQNEYQSSLWYFECKDQFVMKMLIRMIFYHNAKALTFEVKTKKSQMLSLMENYQEPLIIYIQKIIKRTSAAVAIQKTWRRYISNKSQKESIYFKMKKNRAALHLQHFFRESVYRHRSYFSKKLFKDLSIIQSPTIIYPLSLYMNITAIYNSNYKGKLFKGIRLARDKAIGANEEFYRPIFHKSIRDTYFDSRTIGLQNYQKEIDIYSLLHFNSQVKLLTHQNQQYISFTYSSKCQASIIASLIALCSYQFSGKHYVFPLTKEQIQLWQMRFSQYSKINLIKKFINKMEQVLQKTYILKQIRQQGCFLFKASENFIQTPKNSIVVEFYQKKYHNFPVKYAQPIAYSFINYQLETEQQSSNTNTKLQLINRETTNLKQKIEANNESKDRIIARKNQYLNVTAIDRRRFSLFDQSQKYLSANETIKSQKSQLQEFAKTTTLVEENKREKVMKFFKDEFVKKEAQKEMKETSLAAIRQKAKQERVMNTTLRNMKEMERTEILRSKVNKVKQFKSRAVSSKKEEQAEFIQQNNFVMEQQLRMIIMRTKMREKESKRQENLASHKAMTDKSSEIKSIQSRKSSKQKIKIDQDDLINSVIPNNVQGDQGEVINMKKKTRKLRANSIGAYIRDPSFVHGVFPEEYYPIESRATTFYFPPVV